MPQFSIITPVYNSQDTLLETIRSVELQTLGDYEHILIDDCSTDSSPQLCAAYAERDRRVRVLRPEKNGGVSAARNLGLGVARGTYVCFLDADDTWEPSKLFEQHKQAEETGAKFLYTGYYHMSEEGKVLKEIHCPPETDFQQMLNGSVVGCLTVALHRGLIEERRFKNIFHEDYLFWMEILRDTGVRARGLQRPLAKYRLRPNSRSANKKEAALAQWRIYRHHLRLGLPKSILSFLSYGWAGLRKHKAT